MVSCAPCNEIMPRNIQAVYEDDIIARRFLPPALARSTPFNRAISCELKSPFEPWIPDPDPDPHIFESLVTIFWVESSKILCKLALFLLTSSKLSIL